MLKRIAPIFNLEDLKSGKVEISEAMNRRLGAPDIKKHIKWLRGLSLNCSDFDFLKKQLLPLLHTYILIPPEVRVGEFIYRAVKRKEKPNTERDLSYPPAFIVENFGRANRPRRPIFYGSAGCHSTLLECTLVLGDRLAISKWRVKQPMYLAPAGYSLKYFKNKFGISRWNEISWANQYLNDPLAQTPENQLVHDFLAREFTKNVDNPHHYKISAAFSELILDAISFEANGTAATELAGIIYPSVPNELNADNVALKPNIADSHLEFVNVQYVEIKKANQRPEYSCRGLDYASSLSDTGNIEWENKFPSFLAAGTDHTLDLIENRDFVIKDNKGKIVGRLK